MRELLQLTIQINFPPPPNKYEKNSGEIIHKPTLTDYVLYFNHIYKYSSNIFLV